MELSKQLTKWVEKKVGKVINDELKEKIQHENSTFDETAYVDDLLKRFFNEEIDILKKEIENGYFKEYMNKLESDYSSETENSNSDFFDFEPNEFTNLSLDEILLNLQNNYRVNIKSLQALEVSAEDLISHKSWNSIKRMLQNLLEIKTEKEIFILVLKIFNKFLMCYNKPQLVCEGFLSLTEVISLHVEIINLRNNFTSYEEVYDLKENKFLDKNVLSEAPESSGKEYSKKRHLSAEILTKSMWLLLECQKQMPQKWIRFNEKRLREIIFSFIHLLSSTTYSENGRLSGLELVSVLNPTANWCRQWCHTTVGRSLLCAALRKYKNFFIHIVETILSNMTTKRIHLPHTINDSLSTTISTPAGNFLQSLNNKEGITDKSRKIKKTEEKYLEERNKFIRSAPIVPTKQNSPVQRFEKSSKWVIGNIPQKVVIQAKFCHCLCLIVCLIQFRSGRSLFPIQTNYRKRLLCVGDLVLSIINYLENFDSFETKFKDYFFKDAYKQQVSKMLETLRNAENSIPSLRMSADRLLLSQR